MDNETRTLGDLSALELVNLAIQEIRNAMMAYEKGDPGPASGAYAYLHLAQEKLRATD